MNYRTRVIKGKYTIQVRRGLRWSNKYTFNNLEDMNAKLDELENENYNSRYFSNVKYGELQ